jgi:hypothetical protein
MSARRDGPVRASRPASDCRDRGLASESLSSRESVARSPFRLNSRLPAARRSAHRTSPEELRPARKASGSMRRRPPRRIERRAGSHIRRMADYPNGRVHALVGARDRSGAIAGSPHRLDAAHCAARPAWEVAVGPIVSHRAHGALRRLCALCDVLVMLAAYRAALATRRVRSSGRSLP